MKRILFIVYFLIVHPFLLAQEKPGDRATALAEKLLTDLRLPGLSVAVAMGDSVVWARGFGVADVGRKMPVTPSTRFRIGSVTKLLTAASSVRLAQQGKLDLDAPVQKYVPSFPDKGSTITTRQLLGHLSGIRHYGRGEYFNQHHYGSVAEALTVFQDDSLLFVPGSKYSYSSYGYVLASAVIERTSGRAFLPYLKDSLFNPLALTTLSPDENDSLDASQAKPYSLDSLNAWIPGASNDNSIRWAAGGFLSSAGDLVRFGAALRKDGFLNADSRKLLFTSQTTTEGKETGVGIGWRIAKDSAGNVYYHHGGESIGGRAFLLIYPASNVVVAILANLTFARLGEKEALAFARIFSYH